MSIKEWKSEYENASTDKLRLLGVDVIHEYPNGSRIIKLKSSYKLINNMKASDLSHEGFQYISRVNSLGLCELGSEHRANTDFYVVRSSEAVILNENGDIVIDNVGLKHTYDSREEFYKYHVDTAQKALDFMEENIEKLYNAQRKRLSTIHSIGVSAEDVDKSRTDKLFIWRYSYMKVRKRYNLLIVTFEYDRHFCGVIIYNTQSKKVILKSTTAMLHERRIVRGHINGDSVDYITAIAVDNFIFVCYSWKSYWSSHTSVILQDMYANAKTKEELLAEWMKNEHVIDREVISLIDTMHKI